MAPGKVQEYVEEAAKTMVGLPTAGDVVKSGLWKWNPIPYFAAYNAICQDSRMSMHGAIEGYEQMIHICNDY